MDMKPSVPFDYELFFNSSNALMAFADFDGYFLKLRGCLDFSLSAQTGLFVPCLRQFSSK